MTSFLPLKKYLFNFHFSTSHFVLAQKAQKRSFHVGQLFVASNHSIRMKSLFLDIHKFLFKQISLSEKTLSKHFGR